VPGTGFSSQPSAAQKIQTVVLLKAFHRLWRCRLFHLLAFVNKFTTLANKKASPTSLERLCARDWIFFQPESQYLISSVCQICVKNQLMMLKMFRLCSYYCRFCSHSKTKVNFSCNRAVVFIDLNL
jgi:hypothetical protein